VGSSEGEGVGGATLRVWQVAEEEDEDAKGSGRREAETFKVA
jgi:hypothetical protein